MGNEERPDVIELWEEENGRWLWRYRSADRYSLTSAEDFVERDEALDTAEISYPGVPIVQIPGPAVRRRRNRRVLWTAGVLALWLLVKALRKLLRLIRTVRVAGRVMKASGRARP
ncbi:MAG TPA: hypothetical protein VE646_00360 [Actinomycetota bacterium]|jgi:malonyl CoA-acyl carrier protein transacylase|nr:hypothetical protein [Actinomycetota bacterium]